ncbi:hypothetical protein IMCC3317_47480 [Kordia antarctica]|uniref:DUF2024 domain-containing protein n=1 Tax=Kordia antarctica TaxID=1218801 RepID=A0A7L4ZRL7_9FLAO|nr:DUF2024 family protein [Kordia antarctica]QHI39338.1 hypothetical protein IMCC3317_47480 [Kordia antarctica]
MKVSVWDTYIKREDNRVMHFDILVPSNLTDEQKIFSFGADYLQSKSVKGKELTTKECKFCHIETASDEIVAAIEQKGYFIIEMENCA